MQRTDDLAAAAERLRRYNAGEKVSAYYDASRCFARWRMELDRETLSNAYLDREADDVKLEACWKRMAAIADGWNWYWLSYGEKCYAFAVVIAYAEEEGAKEPSPGSELRPHPTRDRCWVGDNGTPMLIEQWVANIEQQSGGAICAFIAQAFASCLARWPIHETNGGT